MKKYPKISILIPLYIVNDYVYEAINRCLELDYPDYEILLGIDKETKINITDPKIRTLSTNEKRTGPAEKRDIGIKKAKGEIIAFLDDDSYPEKNWLKKAVEILHETSASSVCGPGLTPPADGFSKKITGALLGSKFGSGPFYYRFVKGSACFVDDYPAYNMLVKKDVLLKIGGFNNKFYGGEDTALCIKIINAGEKIYYHPEIVVYHHRRKFPLEYMKQVGNVGLHRGYFVKAYPQTSLRFIYFVPAVFTIGFPLLITIAFFNQIFLIWFLGISLLIYLIIFVDGLKNNTLLINLFLPIAVVVNHLAYGFNFIKGLLFVNKLVR